LKPLLLATALVLWAAASFAGAALLASQLPRRWGFAAAPLCLCVLVALPLVDEARAKTRFRALCQERAQVRLGPAHAEGQPVRAGGREVIAHALGPLLAQETRTTFLAAGGIAYDYSTLTAEPGWFAGLLALGTPMLFSRTCAPPELRAFLQRQLVALPAD
jgi:hypothetical protein